MPKNEDRYYQQFEEFGFQVAEKMVVHCSSSRYLQVLVGMLLKSASYGNDDRTKEKLFELRGAFRAIERQTTDDEKKADEAAENKFLDCLMEDIYFQLPVSVPIAGESLSPLIETKSQIIRFVISRWHSPRDEKSRETFCFLLQVIEPSSITNFKPEEYGHKYANLAKDRKYIQSQEREKVLNLIGKHIESEHEKDRFNWDLDIINYWLTSNHVGWRMRQILLMAKAKNCNLPQAIDQEVTGYEILRNAHPERFTPAVVPLLRDAVEVVQQWDEQVKELLRDFEKIPVGVTEAFGSIELRIEIGYGNPLGYHSGEIKDLRVRVVLEADDDHPVIATKAWHEKIMAWHRDVIELWREKSCNFSLRYAKVTYELEVARSNNLRLCRCEEKKDNDRLGGE